MKKVLVLVSLLSAVTLSSCSRKAQPGALRVTTDSVAKVMLDGKEVGNTPYSDENVPAGQVTIKIVPEDSTLTPYEGIIDITSRIVTVVNRQFAATAEQSAGETLTMEPTNQSVASLAVITEPDGAMIKLADQALGPSPVDKGQVDASDQVITIAAPGYADRSIAIKPQTGYKLIVNAKLAKQAVPPIVDLTPSPESTVSATASITPKASITPSTKVTPSVTSATGSKTTPTPTKTSSASTKKVKILSTPTGWLRVREEASANGNEIGKVNPGETYPLIDEQSGWLKIEMSDGTQGWVSGQYATKI